MNASDLDLRSRGYALLEALIALLIISIGLVGISRLQLVGMSSSNISTQRSKAVYLAYEIGDRIRANLSGYSAGAYSKLSGTATNPNCVSTSTGCSAAQIAQNDYYEWSSELSTQLPQGAGVVCLTSTISSTATPAAPGCDGSGTMYAIMVWWTENGQQQMLSQSFRP
ncbi:hypothetical protein LMG7141_02958 [Ralstonia condita]|jgi:type IV pilus assembly protein PilV|uniref:Type IV pilin Tt1218-like domain-containing protein n=1 Tax=Ralstonia condita TaxID=3058600 RepID=A0ABN9J0F0_9RALS|nr:type IV pilus modification protein PilV [Ralstonia sp. LMG 7141]MDE2202269.1 type IV pilus modification protein PilV [Burkholderiaceae bacterium]CAJ0794534.1 hypothetical protein LMG7141_02958 [Ralstonia sp. LMG 7141]